MKSLRILLFTGMSFTFTSMNVYALTLNQFWQDTLKHDPTVQVYRQELEVASEDQPLALAALLPHVSLQAGSQWNEHRIHKPADKYLSNSVLLSRSRNNIINSWSIQIKQAIFNWSALKNYQASEEQVAVAAAKYQQSMQNLERKCIITYTKWLLAYANLVNDKATEKGIAREAFDASARYRAGTIGILDVEETNVALGQIQAQIAKATEKWRASEAEIEKYSGIEAPRKVPPLPYTLHLPSRSARKWRALALKHNPALAAARLELAAARTEVGSAWGGFLPNISIVLAHQWRTENGTLGYFVPAGPGSSSLSSGAGIPDPHIYNGSSVSLQLSWPIFSGGSQQAHLDRAQYRQEQYFSTLLATQLSIKEEISSTLSSLKASLLQTNIYRKSMLLADRASLSAEKGVSVGLVSENNAITDRQNALSVRNGLNAAVASAIEKYATISVIAGNISPALIASLSSGL